MSLPEPLLSADLDLRELDSFMLHTEKLLASELVAMSTGDEFKAAVMLWCRAWKQVPTGSLPDDDRMLASFSGAGSKWKKIKFVALRGFIKCSDGRLYHPMLCKDALRAASKKAERNERTKAATEARKKLRDDVRDVDRNDTQNTNVTKSHRQGQGHGEEEGITNVIPKKSARASRLAGNTPRQSRISSKNAEEDSLFEQFYQAYPKRQAKVDARKAWPKARLKASAELLIDTAKSYAISRLNEDQTYTPLPASWLNAERWQDDLTETKNETNRPNTARNLRTERPKPLDGWALAIAQSATEDYGENGSIAQPLLHSRGGSIP